MATRKLYGVVSSAGPGKISIGGHHDTMDKMYALRAALAKKIKKSHPAAAVADPVRDSAVLVSSGKVAVGDLEGEKVIAWVTVREYAFKSTRTPNAGETVRGWFLALKRIEKNSDW